MKESYKGVERRSEPRHETDLTVNLIISHQNMSATMKNISGGGMEIQTLRSINPNTDLTVSFTLKDEYRFTGKTVWTLGEYIDNKWIYRVGLQTGAITFKNGQAVTSQDKRELVRELLPSIQKSSSEQGAGIKNVA